MKTKKQIFLDSIEDRIDDLFYYNWKNNHNMTANDIDKLIENEEITKKEIIEKITALLNDIEGLK